MESVSRKRSSDLCISDADVLNPLHSKTIMPTRATLTRNRVLVRKTHIALVGGRLAFALFHVTVLGRSIITTEPPWPQHHQ